MLQFRRRRALRWLSLLVIAGLALSACGGDDDDDDDASDAPDTSTEEEGVADKSPFKLGVLFAGSNQGTPVVNETVFMYEAWAEDINEKGGIDGHPVEIVKKDYQGDTAKALQLLKDLESEGVHAVTEDNAAVLTVLRDYVAASKDLYMLCGGPYQKLFEEEPRFFHCGATNSTGVYGQVGVAVATGAKHFQNMYCAEIAACAEAVPVTEQAAKDFGIKHSAQSAPLSATDYTAQCIKAKQDGVDYLQVNGPNLVNVIRDCARQNYHPRFGVVATGQAVVDAVGTEKAAGNLWDFPPFYEGPETREYHRLVATYTDEVETPSNGGVQAYKTVKMFEVIAKIASKAGDAPTRADFLEAIYEVKGETLGGVAPPITYGPKGQPNAKGNCWYGFIIEDGEIVGLGADGKKADKLTPICKK